MQFPFKRELVDTVVTKIRAKNFNILTLPKKDISKNATSPATALPEGRSSESEKSLLTSV